jgi:Periplasmic protein involved in polysaccharide export
MRTCLHWLMFFMVGLVLCTSCGSTKKAYRQTIYFRDITDSLERLAPIVFEQRFQPGDILHISVVTENEKMSALLNQPVEMSKGGSTGAPIGYLVDNDSSIVFPLLGRLKVAGHTKSTFTTELTSKLKYYIDSPIVTVRLMNYRVTILGEVNKPGTYTIPNERVSLLDAIGLAGDLTIYGIRDSIRVIRQNEGKVESGTVNLNSGNFFDSPYFYLKQNDVVYVKMQRRKLIASDQNTLRNVSIIMGILSTLGAVTATIINLSNR